jgi:energy-coupling factor transporter ATP-binding protein EcfA2
MASATVHGCPQLLLVMITHDHAVAEHARRLIVLKDGRIVDDRPVGQRASGLQSGRTPMSSMNYAIVLDFALVMPIQLA